MGSFLGHLLPGGFFLFFGLWLTPKYIYRFLVKYSSRKTCCKYCSVDTFEGCIKIICPAFGILLEQVTNNGPQFHLTNAKNEYLDGNNWSHCTMYMFFIFAGITDILILHAPKHTPKGINNLALGLALLIEGYLFYFHTHGKTMLEIRIHALLVVAIWAGAGALAILWYLEACHAKDISDNTVPQPSSKNTNGYIPIFNQNSEEIVLLDKQKSEENATGEVCNDSTNMKSMQQNIMQQIFYATNASQNISAARFPLQMMVAASILLQGTWFIQIATILYPPGKEGWNEESHTNTEFATVFFTWHLASIIVFLAIIYFTMSAILSRKSYNYSNTHL